MDEKQRELENNYMRSHSVFVNKLNLTEKDIENFHKAEKELQDYYSSLPVCESQ